MDIPCVHWHRKKKSISHANRGHLAFNFKYFCFAICICLHFLKVNNIVILTKQNSSISKLTLTLNFLSCMAISKYFFFTKFIYSVQFYWVLTSFRPIVFSKQFLLPLVNDKKNLIVNLKKNSHMHEALSHSFRQLNENDNHSNAYLRYYNWQMSYADLNKNSKLRKRLVLYTHTHAYTTSSETIVSRWWMGSQYDRTLAPISIVLSDLMFVHLSVWVRHARLKCGTCALNTIVCMCFALLWT